ncbi:DUF2608 domain-containing protein [Candidatus Dependentiae bacterium]|nr:DUF2608 domain-containing protein [Candidatus Dependentiae bacterium]
MKKYTFIIMLFFFNHLLYPYITESDQLKSVFDYIPNAPDKYGILVIYDFDNTLIETEIELGSDQWFYHMMQKYAQNGLSMDLAAQYILPVYYLIRNTIDIVPTESDVADIINKVQNMGVRVIGLTAQGFHIVKRSTEQLKELGIDFSSSAFFGNYIEKKYHCHNGSIFCHGHNKNIVLKEVFEHNNYYPHTIIFIDDKEKNLNYIKDLAHNLGINFYGIRYSRMDKKVAHFDPVIADKQLAHFYRQQHIEPICIPHHIMANKKK